MRSRPSRGSSVNRTARFAPTAMAARIGASRSSCDVHTRSPGSRTTSGRTARAARGPKSLRVVSATTGTSSAEHRLVKASPPTR
jgi:hypothetical protein